MHLGILNKDSKTLRGIVRQCSCRFGKEHEDYATTSTFRKRRKQGKQEKQRTLWPDLEPRRKNERENRTKKRTTR